MNPRPPRSRRTDTPSPYTSLFRSQRHALVRREVALGKGGQHRASDRTGGSDDGNLVAHVLVSSRTARPHRPPAASAARFLRQIGTAGNRGGPHPATSLSSSRSEEHTSELQSLMRISYAVFCLKKKKTNPQPNPNS